MISYQVMMDDTLIRLVDREFNHDDKQNSTRNRDINWDICKLPLILESFALCMAVNYIFSKKKKRWKVSIFCDNLKSDANIFNLIWFRPDSDLHFAVSGRVHLMEFIEFLSYWNQYRTRSTCHFRDCAAYKIMSATLKYNGCVKELNILCEPFHSKYGPKKHPFYFSHRFLK